MVHASFFSQPKLMLLLTAASLTLITTAGCGGPTDGRITVSGTVTIDGAPLSDGSVTFYLDNASSGVGIIENGKFTVSQSATSEGMQPGSYDVAIQSWEVEPGSVNEAGDIVETGKSRIPQKYNSTSTSEIVANITDENSKMEFFLLSK